QAAAHADLAMDAPYGQIHAFALERFFPGQHVLVDAVDQGAVEVEQESRVAAWHRGSPVSRRGQYDGHAVSAAIPNGGRSRWSRDPNPRGIVVWPSRRMDRQALASLAWATAPRVFSAGHDLLIALSKQGGVAHRACPVSCMASAAAPSRPGS